VHKSHKLSPLVALIAIISSCWAWAPRALAQSGAAKPTQAANQAAPAAQAPPASAAPTSGPQIQTPSTAGSRPTAQESPEFNHVVNEIIAHENELVQNLKNYSPRMEVYIQDMRPDPELGAVPVKDQYFLGRVTFRPNRTLTIQSLLPQPGPATRLLKDISGQVTQLFQLRYQPSAFLFSLVMDTSRFNRQNYSFRFIRRQYLGNVRCLVFDVRPKMHYTRGLLFRHWQVGLFEGRIWVEDQHFHIVRFNGGFTPAPAGSAYFHFDSWRENVQPGLWLPVCAYSEESNLKYGFDRTLRFRAQVRFWGYGLENPNHQSEMTRIDIDAPGSEVRDTSEASQDISPVARERDWQEQAQDNVLDRLQKAGLLAPPGGVDKVLETVVNNLIVTNHLNNLPPIHCRVLLTSTLDSLAIGDTIILSRGLIDVLPDEPSLAAMLAHELASIVLQQTMNINSTEWAFEDRLMMPDKDVLRYLKFKPSERDEEAADAKAMEFLKNSPYKDQLGKAGLFLRAMANIAPHTPHLFGAHLGNRLVQGDHVRELAALMNGAPQLKTRDVDQIAALPLGARINVNPWNDTISLMKTKRVALLSAREKMQFEITPMFPYLTRLPAEQARR
jgi:hypothetical protein